MHNHFIELRGQLVLGRSTEISTIMKYVEHGCADLNSCGSGADLSPRIVLASPGSGKSALMAHCTQEIRKVCYANEMDNIPRVTICSFLLLFHLFYLYFLIMFSTIQ